MVKKFFILFTLILALVVYSSASTKEDLKKLQRYVLDLQKQFWDLQEATLKTNQQIIKMLDDMNKEYQVTLSNQSKLINQIEVLLTELQDLKGKMETTNQQLSNLALKVQTQAQVANNASPATLPSQTSIISSQVGIQDEEQKDYQLAYGDYQRGRYDLAISGFANYIIKYPQSEYADNAQYWIGECYFSKKNYLDAIIEFENLIQKYPNSDKIAAAHLKKALAYLKLEKKAQAVVELQTIVQDFADTDEAKLAKEQLKELGFD